MTEQKSPHSALVLGRRILGRVRRAILGGPRIYSSNGEVEKAEYAFYVERLQPGMTVFDIGANVGAITLLFSKFVGPEGKVHAFEPTRATHDRLQRVLDAVMAENVETHRAAVSDKEGTTTFHVYAEHSTLNSLAQRPLQKYGLDLTPTPEEVEVVSIDGFCERKGISVIDLLKIDVEGAEYQVLQGARRMLEGRRIRCITFEFGQTTFDMGNNPKEIERYLRSVGYRLRNLVKGDPAFPGGSRVETAQLAMLVAEPR